MAKMPCCQAEAHTQCSMHAAIATIATGRMHCPHCHVMVLELANHYPEFEDPDQPIIDESALIDKMADPHFMTQVRAIRKKIALSNKARTALRRKVTVSKRNFKLVTNDLLAIIKDKQRETMMEIKISQEFRDAVREDRATSSALRKFQHKEDLNWRQSRTLFRNHSWYGWRQRPVNIIRRALMVRI